MSGGAYEYKYFQLEQLADDIERDFVNGGDYETEDWSNKDKFGKIPMKTENRIGDASEEQKPIILAEINSLIEDLRKCSKRAKELEWYMSGDTSANSYLERLRKEKLIK
jgi:hypothetical protein